MPTKKKLELLIEELELLIEEQARKIEIMTCENETLKELINESEAREREEVRVNKGLHKFQVVRRRGPNANKVKSDKAKAFFAKRFKYHYEQLERITKDKERRRDAGKEANIDTYEKYKRDKGKAANGGYWSATPLRDRIKEQP